MSSTSPSAAALTPGRPVDPGLHDPGGSAGHSLGTRHRVRRWVRRDPPVWPFVWRGLLPTLGLAALGLYAVVPFARQEIEANVRQQVRSALDEAGHRWVHSAVSGQQVLLSGAAPAGTDADAVLAVARGATCASPFGRQICAVSVTGAFTSASTAAPLAPAASATPSAPAAAVAAAQACEQALAERLAGSRIAFASGRADILPSSTRLLDELGQAARACPSVIVVEGHTDIVGTPDANQRLSQARAEAVRQALVARGLPAERLRAEGFGESRPVADNGTEAGRASNRRIEFRALAERP